MLSFKFSVKFQDQYHEKQERNVAECVRKLRTDFGEAPTAQYVRYLAQKVKATAILIDKPKRE